MNRWTVLFATILLTMVVAMGCSGNGGSPVSPNAGPAITGSDPTGQSLGPNTYLAGYYECYLDIPTQTLEVVADRTANFTLNVIPFLNQMQSPKMGITFGSLNVDDSDPAVLKVDVEFQWYHPFPSLEQYKAYDMMGVIISNGDTTMNYEGLTVGQQGTDTYMTNADGYTRWFNPTEFTTTLIFGWAPGGIQNLPGSALINPYKAYGMGLGSEDSLWDWLTGGDNNDGLWESGAGRMMNLEFPMPPDGDGLTFAYAAVVCWVEQGAGPYSPYHRAEPIACRATVTDNVYYDGTTSGGSLILDADLFAWGAQPSTVKVESTVLSGVVDSGPGTVGGDNYSTYHVDVPVDVALDSVDGQEFWVIAECGAYGYYPVTELGEVLDIPSADGVLASFFRFPLTVLPTAPCLLTVGGIVPASATTYEMVTGATITGTNFSAPGLAATLSMGATQIVGTAVHFVNATTMTCDFDLTDAPAGLYDVYVKTNACPTGGTLFDAFEVLPCETTFVGVNPAQGGLDKTVTVHVELASCTDGPFFAAALHGAVDVDGTDFAWVDATHFDATFDLTGAPLGLYDLEVTNGCGGTSDTGIDAFEIVPFVSGLVLIDDGPLPTPYPESDYKDFSVVGSNSFGHAGVYYHAGAVGGTTYTINRFDLDYSAAGSVYRTIVDPFFGNIDGLLMDPQYLASICVEPAGGNVFTDNSTGFMTWGNYPANGPVWWTYTTDGNLANGYLYFNMMFRDLAIGFGSTATVYGYWTNNSAGVDGATYLLTPSYGQTNYTSIDGYFPVDHVGNVDGSIALSATQYAIDDAPQGLDDPFNIIHYYLETSPNTPDIEVMENVTNMAFAVSLTTIKTFTGTPVDIACWKSYPAITDATSNWVCVLENNGTSWQVACFDQTGALITRYDSAIAGTPLHIGCDNTNTKIHVWANDGGTLKYYIFEYQS